MPKGPQQSSTRRVSGSSLLESMGITQDFVRRLLFLEQAIQEDVYDMNAVSDILLLYSVASFSFSLRFDSKDRNWLKDTIWLETRLSSISLRKCR